MRRLDTLGVGLALGLAACSLHSMDYLSDGLGSADPRQTGGNAAAAGGTGPASTGGTGARPASGGQASGGQASGGQPTNGGQSTNAGSGNATSGDAGAPEVPDCHDELATVDETDVDCGGRTCSPCNDGGRCLNGTDCQSAICTNQVCQPPSCTDLALNGAETDLNCGGTCAPCELGHRCLIDADCDDAQCMEGMCRPVNCSEEECPILVDRTPYEFVPSEAPTRCLDDDGVSVEDGKAMVILSCRLELRQTFWAVALTEGYFALQNALSGKCLQVRGGSQAEGAVIEQYACEGGAAQRWKPSRLASGFVRLTNALSGLALGVAGPSYDEDQRPLVQGSVDGSANTTWTVTKRETAAYVDLAGYADKSKHVAHDQAFVTLTTTPDSASTHWRVLPGLANAHGVSFQSRDSPGRYLRHSNFRLWSDTNDGSVQFQRDATFKYTAPFVGTHVYTRSLESFNFPGRYLVQRESGVFLSPAADDANYKQSATWWTLGR